MGEGGIINKKKACSLAQDVIKMIYIVVYLRNLTEGLLVLGSFVSTFLHYYLSLDL